MNFLKKISIFLAKFIFVSFCVLVFVQIPAEIPKPTYTPENDPSLESFPIAILYRELGMTDEKFAIINYGDIASVTPMYAEYTFLIPKNREVELNNLSDLTDQIHTRDFNSTQTPWDSGFRIEGDEDGQYIYAWYDFDSDWENNGSYRVSDSGHITLIEHEIFFGPGYSMGVMFKSLPFAILGFIFGLFGVFITKKIARIYFYEKNAKSTT